MRTNTSSLTRRVLGFLAVLLLAKAILNVLIESRNYVPPNFNSDFLQGREPYF